MKDLQPASINHGVGDGINDGHDPVIHGYDGITNEGADICSKVGAGSGGISTEEG